MATLISKKVDSVLRPVVWTLQIVTSSPLLIVLGRTISSYCRHLTGKFKRRLVYEEGQQAWRIWQEIKIGFQVRSCAHPRYMYSAVDSQKDVLKNSSLVRLNFIGSNLTLSSPCRGFINFSKTLSVSSFWNSVLKLYTDKYSVCAVIEKRLHLFVANAEP